MRQNSAYTAYYGSVSYSSRFVFVGRCRKRTTSRYCCSFPFIYKGRRYNSCTKKKHNRPWCSLTGNYDRDKKWGNCAGKFKILLPPKNLSSPYYLLFVSYILSTENLILNQKIFLCWHSAIPPFSWILNWLLKEINIGLERLELSKKFLSFHTKSIFFASQHIFRVWFNAFNDLFLHYWSGWSLLQLLSNFLKSMWRLLTITVVLRNENIILLIYFFSGRRPVRPVKPVRPIRPGKNCTRNISVHFTIFILCKYLAIHSSYFNLCLQEQL